MARILVVDDNQSVRAAIGAMLEHEGHTAVLVEGGRSGSRAIQCEDFDLLMVDIFMPEMDGFEFITLARKQRPALPIIVMSGSSFGRDHPSTPDFLRMATKLGADWSLCKPFRPAALHEALETCLPDCRRASPPADKPSA